MPLPQSSSEGSRNNSLNEAAFSLGTLVGTGSLSRATVESELIAAASQCGLPESEARKTIQSGVEAGMLKPRETPEQPAQARASGVIKGLSPIVVRMSDVTPRPIRWLWQDKFALGKLTLLAGDGGTGKSFITLDMAVRISRGAPWPDGCDSMQGSCLFVACEDALDDTVHPRLTAAGAALEKINVIQAVRRGDERELVSLEDHLPVIEDVIRQLGDCRLLVVDPISAFLSRTDENSNRELRRALTELSELAIRCETAVCVVHHLRKSGGSAKNRTLGSVAFIAAVRMAFICCEDTDDPERLRHYFLPSKSNLSRCRAGLAYCVDDDGDGPRAIWEPEPVYIAADDALIQPEHQPEASTKLAQAMEWLTTELASGPRLVKELIEQGQEQTGCSERTLKAAKSRLQIIAKKDQYGGGWTWSLPPWCFASLHPSGKIDEK